MTPNEMEREFLRMLPKIRSVALFQFRRYRPELKEETVQQVVAMCWRWYVQLCQQGKSGLAFSTTLANYACKKIRSRRKHSRDALDHTENASEKDSRRLVSWIASERRSLTSLDCVESGADWHDIFAVDGRYTPDEIKGPEIDFEDFLGTLSGPLRITAESFASGESTGYIAKKLGLSKGRISQRRAELSALWNERE